MLSIVLSWLFHGEMAPVSGQVSAMVQKDKKAVAGKSGLGTAIIIPVENIMLVDELERESEDKDALLDRNG